MNINKIKFNKKYIAALLAGTAVFTIGSYNLINNKRKEVELDDYIRGCDISSHQVYINWEELNKNYDFVILRSMIGDSIDQNFEENYKNAHKNNIKVGAYYFNTLNTTNTENLEDFKNKLNDNLNVLMNSIDKKKIDFPVYLDVEGEDIETKLPKEYMNTLIDTFKEKVNEKELVPGIYSNKKTYRYMLECNDKIIEDFEIWLAGGTTFDEVTTLEETNSTNNIKDEFKETDTVQLYQYARNAGAGDRNGNLDIDYSLKDYSEKKSNLLNVALQTLGIITMGTSSVLIYRRNKMIKRK